MRVCDALRPVQLTEFPGTVGLEASPAASRVLHEHTLRRLCAYASHVSACAAHVNC